MTTSAIGRGQGGKGSRSRAGTLCEYTVAPGWTETEGNEGARQNEATVRNVIAQTALGRLGRPDDIAAVVAFLASDDGRWVTGQYIEASGGLRLV